MSKLIEGKTKTNVKKGELTKRPTKPPPSPTPTNVIELRGERIKKLEAQTDEAIKSLKRLLKLMIVKVEEIGKGEVN